MVPTNPDIAYLGGQSLWKAIRNSSTDRWDIEISGHIFTLIIMHLLLVLIVPLQFMQEPMAVIINPLMEERHER